MKTRKVLVSPGYGAGWSSWHHEHQQEIAEYAPIIEYIENGGDPADLDSGFDEPHPLVARMQEELKLGHFYAGGAAQLRVVEVSGPYRVDEYDGSEWVTTTAELWN